MKRILVDLRIFLAVMVVLGLALAIIALALASVYNAPVQHEVDFRGTASAKVTNYSTVLISQNFTESGIPAGALLGIEWDFSGPGGEVAILAYAGPTVSAPGAEVCDEGPTLGGSCAWMANGQSYTVSIWEVISYPGESSANFTTSVSVWGWFTYSSPAR